MLKMSFKQGKDGPDGSWTRTNVWQNLDAHCMGEHKQHFLVYQLHF